MDPLLNARFSVPITTGATQVGTQQGVKPTPQPVGESFQELLRQRISQNSSLEFSKHAVSRVAQRSIDISQSNMQRLDEGVRMAQQKGLVSPLILVDTTAYIVNVPSNTVITTLNGDDLKGNVFTNIDGTVII